MIREIVDTSSQTGGSLNKVRAWGAIAAGHIPEMRVAKGSGLFPKKEGWRNTVEHSLVVHAAAMFLARILVITGYPVDQDIIDKASLVHDVAKRRDKKSNISRSDEHTKGATRVILERAGYSEDIIQVAEYTGRVPEINLSPEEQISRLETIPVENLIVAYADARVRNTNIVSLEKARDENKIKVPTDSGFYDKWYDFYRRVEGKLIDLSENSFEPDDLTCARVSEMVEADYYQTNIPI